MAERKHLAHALLASRANVSYMRNPGWSSRASTRPSRVVVGAHKRTKNYRANPVRPLVCALENGRLQAIGECTPNVLEYGDVMRLVYMLIYVEDREDWGPVPMVTHVIRVQRANRDAYPLTSALAVLDPVVEHEGLLLGAVVDGECEITGDRFRNTNDGTQRKKLRRQTQRMRRLSLWRQSRRGMQLNPPRGGHHCQGRLQLRTSACSR